MSRSMSKQLLRAETACYQGTGGVSSENRCYGFQPAFMDRQTQAIHLSRFADGRPAPFHLLDGLPDELVLTRNAAGGIATLKPSVISGFVFRGRFYTREDAARSVAEAH